MIKKYLLGLGFTLLGLLSFTNAGKVEYIGYSTDSVNNFEYKIMVNGKGNLLTNFYGLGKRILQLDKGLYFFWYNDGLPYMYVSSISNDTMHNPSQGFLQSYFMCDYIGMGSGNAIKPQNCVEYPIENQSEYNVVRRILNTLNDGGYYYYNSYGCYNSSNKYYRGFDVCFSSSEFYKSVCFYGGSNQEFDNGYTCDDDNFGLGSIFYIHIGNKNYYRGNLSGSLNLSPFFDNIDSSVLGSSPAGNGGDMPVTSGVGNSVPLNGNIVYKPCTWGNAMKYFEVMGYNPNICYGGLNTFDVLTGDYIAVPRSGKNVFDIYDQLHGFDQSEEDFFNEWLNIYNNAYDGNYYDQVLNGQPTVLRTYFDFYRQYGVFDVSSMLFYCDSYFRNDPDRPLIYSEFPISFRGDFNFVCNYSSTDNGTLSNSGTAVSVDWSGIGNINSGNNNGNVGTGNTGIVNTQNIYDGVSFITDYFNKLKSYYSNPSGNSNGILPSYIVTFLLAVMLFKFLRK